MMTLRAGLLALTLAVPLAVSAPVQAQELDEARIKQLALEAILENPGIIMEAVAILEQQRAEAQAVAQARALTEQRALLENDPTALVLGNPEGDVTVVEFVDYNCSFCRRAHAEVAALLAQDENVRLVIREWPILSDGSAFAARAALASQAQGLYAEFHEALITLPGRAEEASVLRAAASVGLDVDRLVADMDSPEVTAHLATSTQLAQALGFNGTPAFVIGETLVPGFVETGALVDLVAQTREDG